MHFKMNYNPISVLHHSYMICFGEKLSFDFLTHYYYSSPGIQTAMGWGTRAREAERRRGPTAREPHPILRNRWHDSLCIQLLLLQEPKIISLSLFAVKSSRNRPRLLLLLAVVAEFRQQAKWNADVSFVVIFTNVHSLVSFSCAAKVQTTQHTSLRLKVRKNWTTYNIIRKEEMHCGKDG